MPGSSHAGTSQDLHPTVLQWRTCPEAVNGAHWVVVAHRGWHMPLLGGEHPSHRELTYAARLPRPALPSVSGVFVSQPLWEESLLHKLGCLELEPGCSQETGSVQPNTGSISPPVQTTPPKQGVWAPFAAQGGDGHPWVLHSLQHQLPGRSDESPVRNALFSWAVVMCQGGNTASAIGHSLAAMPLQHLPSPWVEWGGTVAELHIPSSN